MWTSTCKTRLEILKNSFISECFQPPKLLVPLSVVDAVYGSSNGEVSGANGVPLPSHKDRHTHSQESYTRESLLTLSTYIQRCSLSLSSSGNLQCQKAGWWCSFNRMRRHGPSK